VEGRTLVHSAVGSLHTHLTDLALHGAGVAHRLHDVASARLRTRDSEGTEMASTVMCPVEAG